jgi:Fic/DOC family
MTDWLEHAQRLTACQPLERLTAIADLHAEFARIHPFLDGNGREGRLVTNLLLVRLGYPPAVIYRTQRDRYITCLGRADAGDAGPLAELLARSATDTLHKFIMPAVAGPYRQVPLAALADEDVTARALRNAAERGRLKATRGRDGQWRSSRRAVTEYKRSRYRRAGTDLSGWKGLARTIGEPASTARTVLPGLVDVLSPRHRRMLQLSFGLTPTRREEAAATARRFGITEARVNHIVAEGLVMLRERMEYRRLAATSGLPPPP